MAEKPPPPAAPTATEAEVLEAVATNKRIYEKLKAMAAARNAAKTPRNED